MNISLINSVHISSDTGSCHNVNSRWRKFSKLFIEENVKSSHCERISHAVTQIYTSAPRFKIQTSFIWEQQSQITFWTKKTKFGEGVKEPSMSSHLWRKGFESNNYPRSALHIQPSVINICSCQASWWHMYLSQVGCKCFGISHRSLQIIQDITSLDY